MVYVILIIGLILIFLALKGKKIKINTHEDFDNIIDKSTENFYEREILRSYSELEDKVIDLEDKINALEEKLSLKDKELAIFYENITKEIKTHKDIKINCDSDVNMDLDEIIKEDNKGEDANSKNDFMNREVISLYKEGKSVEQIASSLKIGKGEVLLRIGLNKQGM